MSFSDEELRMKATEISFRTVSSINNARIFNDQVFSLDYFQFVDEIVKYIRTGDRTIKTKIRYK